MVERLLYTQRVGGSNPSASTRKKMTNKTVGTISVLEVIENEDGTANVVFDISDEFKDDFVRLLNLSEWSDKKFEEYVVAALIDYTMKKESEDGND